MILAIAVPSSAPFHLSGKATGMPGADRTQVRGSSSGTRLPAIPEAGDMPGKREIFPLMSDVSLRVRGGAGDRGGPGEPLSLSVERWGL